jgi:transposase
VPRSRPPYPPEFRSEAVRLAKPADESIAQIASDLGISDQTLRNWVAQGDVDAGKRPGLSSDERAKLRVLRKQNRRLREEREILKKAAAFFTAKPSVGSRGASLHPRGEGQGIETSMGAQGSALDNAVAESFFASLKKDLINRYSWSTRADARVASFEWIEAFYNRIRLHSIGLDPTPALTPT